MPSALETVHTIKPAETDLAMRLGMVLFVRGPLRAHAPALQDLWSRLQAGLLRRRIVRARRPGDVSWMTLPDSSGDASFVELFDMRGPLIGRWGLELSDDDGTGPDTNNLWLQLSDLSSVRGMERASHLRLLFPDDTPAGRLGALGEWAVNRLPVWWGCAGFVFHHTRGTMVTAHTRMAALAKRYWAVQIQDIPSLQWVSLEGMPAVNWLTLIGGEFAQSKAFTLDGVAADAAQLSAERISYRQGPHGVALAAGAAPIRGDINVDEDVAPYVRVAERIQPLLLKTHPPLFGPFARAEVMQAWLHRFTAPDAWLGCDLTTR